MAGSVYLATIQWIWCGIDGTERCWRLAVERPSGMVYFPVEDIEERSEYFENCPRSEIGPPEVLPEIRCKFCRQLRPATKEWIRYHQDEPVCKLCWDDRLTITG